MDDVVEGLARYLTSPNVLDRNGNPANLVDTTQHIAEALDQVLIYLQRITVALEERT